MPIPKPNYDADAQTKFCADISAHYGSDVVTTKQVNDFIKERGMKFPHFLINKVNSAGWGKYHVRAKAAQVAPAIAPVVAPVVAPVAPPVQAVDLDSSVDVLVPQVDPTYVPFGFYTELTKIIQSKVFFPVYITGHSGNGKTLMPLQICAKLGREIVRVNITKDTDELDLYGCDRLVNGNTVYREGPVMIAMRRGAILLLDECDYGTERLLCLQPVLEGKPVLNKKTGQMIYPQPGFNIIATANTKGKGSADGRYIGANVMNEAFLERFAITVEQDFPNAATEARILLANFKARGVSANEANDFTKILVKWAEGNRKTVADGAMSDIISTRRLVSIAVAYSIFGDRKQAVQLCLNRFEDETKVALMDFYTKFDAEVQESKRTKEQTTTADAVIGPDDGGPPVSTPGTSSIEFLRDAAALTKAYGTPVVIRRTSLGDTEVISHGTVTTVPGIATWDQLKRAIEANMATARVTSTT